MSKYKIDDKIMGISTDILGIRIVSGTIKKIIDNKEDEDLIRYAVNKDNKSDTIYEGEATEYDGWKLAQAETFFDEALRLEEKAEDLIEMARTEIYSKNIK